MRYNPEQFLPAGGCKKANGLRPRKRRCPSSPDDLLAMLWIVFRKLPFLSILSFKTGPLHSTARAYGAAVLHRSPAQRRWCFSFQQPIRFLPNRPASTDRRRPEWLPSLGAYVPSWLKGVRSPAACLMFRRKCFLSPMFLLWVFLSS